MNVFFHLFWSVLITITATEKANYQPIKQEVDCYTIRNFNSIVDYIKNHGKQIKMSKRLLADKQSFSLEISIGNRFIELEDYQDHKRIIIIDKSKQDKIPPYSISNENDEIQISAYYSRFDIERDRTTRAADWCAVISEFKKKTLIFKQKKLP